jgi:hypothetical protein
VPSFCLDCRTLLDDDPECDFCSGRVVRLDRDIGRAALEDDAWRGSEEHQPRGWLTLLCAAIFGVGGLVALIAVTVVSVKRDWGIFPLEIILGTVLWMVAWVPIVVIPARFPKKVMRRVGRGVAVPSLVGEALPTDPEPLAERSIIEGTTLHGTVRCDALEAATGLEVRVRNLVTFRHAETRGFAIYTNDGQAVHVPPGRLRIFLPQELRQTATARLDEGDLRAQVAEATGLRERDVDRLVPNDAHWRWRLHDGDEVFAGATLLDVPATDASYRDHAVTERRATGVVWLQRK